MLLHHLLLLLLDLFFVLHQGIEYLLGILFRNLVFVLLSFLLFLFLLLLLLLLFLLLLFLLLLFLLLLFLLLLFLLLLLLLLLLIFLILLLFLLFTHVHGFGQVVTCLVIVRIVAHRFLECLYTLWILLRHVAEHTHIVVYLCQPLFVGLELGSCGILLHGLLPLLLRLRYLIEECIAEVVQCISRTGVQFECFAVLNLSLLEQAVGIEFVSASYIIVLGHHLRCGAYGAAEEYS